MCLFLLSVKFFIQISKWFLGPINAHKWVLFHVKWYPHGWGSAGFFPCVSWSNEWLSTCSRSWWPTGVHQHQLVSLALTSIFTGTRLCWWWCPRSLLLACPVFCAVSQRLHLTKGCSFLHFDWQKFPSLFWVFPSLNCHFPALQEQGVHLIYIKASPWHDIVLLVQFVLTVSRLGSSITVNSVWFLSLCKTLCGDKP